jgi:N-terminal region of glycosyl transferase group 7
VKLNTLDVPTIDQLVQRHSSVQTGGHWSPATCRPWQKVAIVIPYRDRYTHLLLLLDRLHSLLQKQMIYYRIFVIEQV